MRRIIFALLLCISSAWTLAQDAKPLELAPDAPDRYIVVPGDTLWGISSKFLKDPYRWSELWKMNPEDIKNPHRIYPGQVLLLDKSGANPELKFGPIVKLSPQIHIEQESKAIPSIPSQVIEPYISRPMVMEADGLENTPRIIAVRDDRIYVSKGEEFYATGLNEKTKYWQAFRPGRKFVEPETKELLGYEAEYLGDAVLKVEGSPATLEVTSSTKEIGKNDRLVPAPKVDISAYTPHAPEKHVKGRVLSVADALARGGKYFVVAISLGKRDGMEPGHVLAAYSAGLVTKNRFKDRPETHQLPDERVGLMFVFRVFDKVSYALITQAKGPVTIGDMVRKP